MNTNWLKNNETLVAAWRGDNLYIGHIGNYWDNAKVSSIGGQDALAVAKEFREKGRITYLDKEGFFLPIEDKEYSRKARRSTKDVCDLVVNDQHQPWCWPLKDGTFRIRWFKKYRTSCRKYAVPKGILP